MKESLSLENPCISMEEHKVMFLLLTPYFGLNLDPCRGRKVFNSVQSKQKILTFLISRKHSQGPTGGSHGFLLELRCYTYSKSAVEDQDLHIESVHVEKSVHVKSQMHGPRI